MIQGSNVDGARNLDGRRDGGFVCPVCLERVFGDPDVAEAHVDACLVHAVPSAHEETAIDVGGPSRTRVTDGANLTGLIPRKKKHIDGYSNINFAALGFHVRDANHEDVEEEIDVYGDDNDVFGQAQFTEVDILSASRSMSANRESEMNVEVSEPSIPLSKHPSSDSHPVSCLQPPPPRFVLMPRTYRNHPILHRRAGSASTRIPNLPSRLNAGIHAAENAGYAA